jgi:hypothetical protein
MVTMANHRQAFAPPTGISEPDWIAAYTTMHFGLGEAARRHSLVTYREAARLAPSLEWTNYPDWSHMRNQMSYILDDVMVICHQNNEPPMTVLVVREGDWMPSEGFYISYQRLFRPNSSLESLKTFESTHRAMRDCWKYWLKR